MKTNIYKTTRKFEYKGAGTNDYIEKVYDTDDDCESRIEHKKYKKEDGTEVEISKTFGSDWDEDNSFELCNTTTVEKDTEGNKLTKFDSDMMYSERIEDKNDIIITETYLGRYRDNEKPVTRDFENVSQKYQIQETTKETYNYKNQYGTTEITNYDIDKENELKVSINKSSSCKVINGKPYVETKAKVQFKCENGNVVNYDISEGFITAKINNPDGNLISEIDYEPVYTNFNDYDYNGNIINRQTYFKQALEHSYKYENYYDEQNRLTEVVEESTYSKMPPASWYQGINPYENLWDKYRGTLL